MLAIACSVDERGLEAGTGGTDALGGTAGGRDGATGGVVGSEGGSGRPTAASGGVSASGSGGIGGTAPGGNGGGGRGAGGFTAAGHGGPAGMSSIGGSRGGNSALGGRGGTPGEPQGGAGGQAGQNEGGKDGGGGATPGTGGAASGGGGSTATGSGGSVSTGGAGSGAGGSGPGGMAGGAGGGPPLPCGPATCMNGCCENNSCIINRSAAQCGSGGLACGKCAKCFRCGTSNSCEVDPASPWKVVCASATISMTKADSSLWDPVAAMSDPKSAPPDPFCQLKLDGSTTVMTSTKKDMLMPMWNESITPTTPPTANRLMSQSNPWSISLYDDDSSVSDLICQLNPQFSAAAFSAGTVMLSGALCPSVTINLSCALP
jgi:hypothetical protein